ncbi:hypothetical protein L226DRAFT_604293 [Lentinus tigrinus ALCF2SS1-7]|uniref:uncharacterized protein n=1 Tax=Lentinus tigrinus ALCF2SS1-7 TaxID=1328758 RepID=UPI001165F968|nr:hypothetical protein L226DRAFT_604293 [Lentinus tigrinus ALCF2SS1-7]
MAPNDTAALEEQIRRATEQLRIAREQEAEEKRRLEAEEKRRLEEETRKAVEKARKREEEKRRKKEEEKKRPRMAATAACHGCTGRNVPCLWYTDSDCAKACVACQQRQKKCEGGEAPLEARQGKKKPRAEPIVVDDDDDDDDDDAPGPLKPRSKGKGKEKEKSAPAPETPPTKKRPAPESEAPPPKKKKTGPQPLQRADEGPSTDHEERRLRERTRTLEEELRALDGKDLLVRSVLEVTLLREVIAPLRREIRQAGWASSRVEAWRQYFDAFPEGGSEEEYEPSESEESEESEQAEQAEESEQAEEAGEAERSRQAGRSRAEMSRVESRWRSMGRGVVRRRVGVR